MDKKSSKTLKTRLTTLWKNEVQPAPLIIWATGCEDGRIVCRPHVVTGPVRHFLTKFDVPPEWLERCIPIADDEEDASCR